MKGEPAPRAHGQRLAPLGRYGLRRRRPLEEADSPTAGAASDRHLGRDFVQTYLVTPDEVRQTFRTRIPN